MTRRAYYEAEILGVKWRVVVVPNREPVRSYYICPEERVIFVASGTPRNVAHRTAAAVSFVANMHDRQLRAFVAGGVIRGN
jgi:hypothetical protein